MKDIQIVLNAVLSKNVFEYILIDKEFEIIKTSSYIDTYFGNKPKEGDDVFSFLPELIGAEGEIAEIFVNSTFKYLLESVYKNEYYMNISLEYYDQNTVLILLHNITDITLSKQKILQYSNESILLNNTLQKILDSQNALLFVTNNEEITYTNEQFLEYFSIKKVTEIKRKNLQLYKYFDNNLESYDALFEQVNSKEEYIVINSDTFILQASMIESTHKLFTLTNVTKLSNEIQMDALTGVYKKPYFNIRLEKVIRDKEEAILVVVDIDNFKVINDTFGHQVGDDVLKEFASLVQNNIRSEDLFARWGGEEFLLLLQHTTLENALKKIESIRTHIEKHTFKHIGNMTSSFGVAYKEESDDIHSLLQRADKALYESKHNGKNRVEFKNI